MEYHYSYDGLLFPVDEFLDPNASIKACKPQTHTHRKNHCNNLDISLSYEGVGSFDMFPLSPYNGPIPRKLIPFSAAISSTEYDCGVHFYIDDYQFERIWTNIHRYIPILKRFSCVIGPDFSQFRDMPYPMRIWNSFRNRVVSTELQNNGVNLIPNVTWSLPDSYDYSFDGMPNNSVIAINCTSIINNNLSKYFWYKGYEEALARLNPKGIIRYGTIMPGEKNEISYYYQNERLNLLKNGR